MNDQLTEVLTFIPQRPPFVFIDEIVEVSELKIVGQFEVLANNVLVTNGRLAEGGLIECMAQTVAAGAGYEAVQNNADVKLGYIAALRNLQIFRLAAVGEILKTIVKIVNHVLDVTITQTEVFAGTEKIAECEMRIYIKNE